MKRFIGCDPGVSGALVCISDDGFEIIPYDEENYREALDRWAKDDCVMAIEKVGSMPGQGVSATFNFGTNWGFIRGMCYAFRIPVQLITPQTWKKEFGLNLGKKYSKADKKAKTIQTAKEMFPDISLKKTSKCRTDDDGIADALMIAEFCRRRLG